MMPTVSRDTCGVLAMVSYGAITTGILVLAKLLLDKEWPFYSLMSAGCVVMALAISTYLRLFRVKFPERRLWKWVVLRGFFGTASFVLLLIAVQVGASPGDVAALSSLNTIMAALLGRAILKEPLRWTHSVALICCVGGATLISKPEFLFGKPSHENPWLGYTMAVLAGLFQCAVAICARKSGSVDPFVLVLATVAWASVVYAAISHSALVPDCCIATLRDHERLGAGIMASLWLCEGLAILANTAGSMWCPAAVSSTTNTGAMMVCGYLAQVIIFHDPVEVLTLSGAALMLLGMAVMTSARAPPPPPESCAAGVPAAPCGGVTQVVASVDAFSASGGAPAPTSVGAATSDAPLPTCGGACATGYQWPPTPPSTDAPSAIWWPPTPPSTDATWVRPSAADTAGTESIGSFIAAEFCAREPIPTLLRSRLPSVGKVVSG